MDTTLNATGSLLYSLLSTPVATRHTYTITIIDSHDGESWVDVNAPSPGAAISKAISTYFPMTYDDSVDVEVLPSQDAVTVLYKAGLGYRQVTVGFFASDPRPIRLQRVGDPVPLSA